MITIQLTVSCSRNRFALLIVAYLVAFRFSDRFVVIRWFDKQTQKQVMSKESVKPMTAVIQSQRWLLSNAKTKIDECYLDSYSNKFIQKSAESYIWSK